MNGFETVPIWLADYISLDDDVRIEDVAKRMHEVLQEEIASGQLKTPFDMIVHSTGGLVARQWIVSYYPDGNGCPLQRLVMLAPANFGSRLASLGQSFLGRVIKGWRNWFHTGKEMLRALELASVFQWQLAQQDLFIPQGQAEAPSPYGIDRIQPFVIIGTHPYPDLLRQIVNENGSDGTVRVPAANLNVRGITIDFAKNESEPVQTEWQSRHGPMVIPFAVLPDRHHGSIIDPMGASDVGASQPIHDQLGQLILAALSNNSQQQYQQLADEWKQISEKTASLVTDDALRNTTFPGTDIEPDCFHQHFLVIVRVVDDHGLEVGDYFLEFFAPDVRSNDEVVYFHRSVLTDVHTNNENPALRCLFIDRFNLMSTYYELISDIQKRLVAMSVSANPPGDNISYFANSKIGAQGHVVVHSADENAPAGRWLQRNCTHFIKIVIPRTPTGRVFRLSEFVPTS